VILPPGGTPTATFTTSPSTVVVGNTVNFDASASLVGTGASTITSYNWVFGDGTTGTGKTTTHVYTAANTYNVVLTVTNDRGLSASSSPTPVTVGAAVRPTAVFNFSPSAPVPGGTVFFNASASTAGPGHSIADYRWFFGDGREARGQIVQHPYEAAGTYAVTLTVVDDADQQATTTQSVAVKAAAP